MERRRHDRQMLGAKSVELGLYLMRFANHAFRTPPCSSELALVVCIGARRIFPSGTNIRFRCSVQDVCSFHADASHCIAARQLNAVPSESSSGVVSPRCCLCACFSFMESSQRTSVRVCDYELVRTLIVCLLCCQFVSDLCVCTLFMRCVCQCAPVCASVCQCLPVCVCVCVLCVCVCPCVLVSVCPCVRVPVS